MKIFEMNAKIKKVKVIYQVGITPQKMFNVSVSEEFNPIIINRITPRDKLW